jgi:hypothetical protein
VRDDGREVVYSFVGYCNFCAHPTSLTQFSVSRENSHELSVPVYHYPEFKHHLRLDSHLNLVLKPQIRL